MDTPHKGKWVLKAGKGYSYSAQEVFKNKSYVFTDPKGSLVFVVVVFSDFTS